MIRYHGYDDGGRGPNGHDYAGRWIRGILWFVGIWTVVRLVMLHVGLVAHWLALAPVSVHFDGMGLPVQSLVVATEHPRQFARTFANLWPNWIMSILGRFP